VSRHGTQVEERNGQEKSAAPKRALKVSDP
jgi:hypothetical protein